MLAIGTDTIDMPMTAGTRLGSIITLTTTTTIALDPGPGPRQWGAGEQPGLGQALEIDSIPVRDEINRLSVFYDFLDLVTGEPT